MKIAQEILRNKLLSVFDSVEIIDNKIYNFKDEIIDSMKEYAKLVAEQVLKDASENAEVINIDNPNYDGCFTSTSCSCIKYIEVVDKESILNTEIKLP